jgi:hypothetical protein
VFLAFRLLGSLLGAATLAIAAGACQTTRTTQSASTSEEFVVSRAKPDRAWRVAGPDRDHGFVVQFREQGSSERTYFSVRNLHLQDLGIVDEHGRAYRYRPHQRDPEWVGSGTVLEGARRILDAPSACSLEEVALGALDPVARTE